MKNLKSLKKVPAGNLIACGPRSKQPCTREYQVVLVESSGFFIVGNMYFPGNSMETNDYFPLTTEGLCQATIAFGRRCTNHAPYLRSIDRN